MNPASPRHYLLSRPEYFEVAYRINPWMDPGDRVDRELAGKQWRRLRETLEELGHAVYELPSEPGLPDMVYAANGGFVLDGVAYGARFRHPQRAAEAGHHQRWYEQHGWRFRAPSAVNEGEGDLVWTGTWIVAGYGFRTEAAAHQEVQEIFGRPVISLRLTDPRFYHLDTALAVLREPGHGRDRAHVTYYPGAFSPSSQQVLRQVFPDAVLADAADAAAFGLNLLSDGHHVILNTEATGMAGKVAAAGYEPVPVELSELKKGGGSIKCCVQELRGEPLGGDTAR